MWDTTISIVFCCFVSFPPYYISLPPPTPKGDYAINREGIEYVPICFIYNFMGFPKNLFMGIFKFIFFGQLKKKKLFLTDDLELFFLGHVALLRSEFIARILVPVVAFLLMWLLETCDFGRLTNLKPTYEGWLNMLIM